MQPAYPFILIAIIINVFLVCSQFPEKKTLHKFIHRILNILMHKEGKNSLFLEAEKFSHLEAKFEIHHTHAIQAFLYFRENSPLSHF